MADNGASRLEQALGFSIPPHRLDYENHKTDYGIGILGLHWVVQIMHLPAYRAARFNVAAACEIVQDRIRETRMKGFQAPILSDWKELMARDDVDVIDCSFGHSLEKEQKRLQVVRDAAAAGKHLMTHKPAARTLAVAEEMARVADQGGIRLAVNQDGRYNPAVYTIKQLLTPERLGQPCVIELQNYWTGNPKPLSDRNGAWISHTIHHADMIRWWVGCPCVSVFSRVGMRTNMTTYEFENGTIAYHMENHSGVTAHETNIRVAAEKGTIRAAHNWNWHYAAPGKHEFVEVFNDRRLPGINLPLPTHVYEPIWYDINKYLPVDGPCYDLAAPIAGMMGSMGSLMRGIELDQAPDNSMHSAIESLRMCLAQEISAERGQPVDPRDVPSETVGKWC